MISKRTDLAIVATMLAAKIVLFVPVSPTVAATWRESARLATAIGARNHLETDPAPSTRRNPGNEEVNEKAIDRRSIGNDDRWDAVPGTPGMDYPDHAVIPATSFTCLDKRPGGYYADVETGCQVFHVCNIGGVKSSFLCPTGSIFNERYFVCDWWYSFDCVEAPSRCHDESFDSTSASPESSTVRIFTSDPIVVLSHGADSPTVGESSTDEKHPDEQNPSNELIGIGNRKSLSKSFVVESFGAKNDEIADRAHANESRPSANVGHDDLIIRTRDEKVPRGFSLYQDDDDREKRIMKHFDRHSYELDNDLASYVNYAYFEARSNDSDNESEY